MKKGYRAREAAALDRAEQYLVDDSVRNARGIALALFDLRRRQSDADQRVDVARAKLERVDVAALEAELSAALAEQAALSKELRALETATLAA